MSKIPTAEEFLKQFELGNTGKIDIEDGKEAIIEFARLHTEAALKAASKVKVYEQVSYRSLSTSERESIYTAYPLTNIK